MDLLEKYFSKKRAQFDNAEPSAGHFARFEAMLNEEFGEVEKSRSRVIRMNRPMLLRIAAGFVVICTLSFFTWDFVKTRNAGKSAGMAISSEIEDAINYYDEAAAAKLGTIRTLACCGKEKEEIYDMASGELKSLDMNTAELKAALKSNPENERIQAAIIQNQQMKVKIMDEMIDQMNKIRK